MGAAQPRTGPGVLAAGGCSVWPLSLDAACAREARQAFREAAANLGLSEDQLYDGVTMASELAANTLHAHDNVELDGSSGQPLAGFPELWLYLRRAGARWELVCKVFDSGSGWPQGPDGPGPPHPPAAWEAGAESVSGRGLQVVDVLSQGRWGHHLTRSRLGGWKVPGKAVWFAQPVPDTCVPGCLRRAALAAGRAARTLEIMLTERGLGGRLLRADEASAGMSVLSVRVGLTVWCRERVIWWQAADGSYEQRVPTDLVETAERIVCTCEEMDSRGSAWRASG
jgi:hypothetical protein